MESKILVIPPMIPQMIPQMMVEKKTQVELLLKLFLLHMVTLPIWNTRLIMNRNLSLK